MLIIDRDFLKQKAIALGLFIKGTIEKEYPFKAKGNQCIVCGKKHTRLLPSCVEKQVDIFLCDDCIPIDLAYYTANFFCSPQLNIGEITYKGKNVYITINDDYNLDFKIKQKAYEKRYMECCRLFVYECLKYKDNRFFLEDFKDCYIAEKKGDKLVILGIHGGHNGIMEIEDDSPVEFLPTIIAVCYCDSSWMPDREAIFPIELTEICGSV